MTATQSRAPERVRAPRAGRARGRYRQALLGAAGVVAVLAVWQISAATGLVDTDFTSSPWGALDALITSITTGGVWAPLGSTLSIVLWGMLISVVVGIPLGLVIGRHPVLHGLTEPLIGILYSVPYVVFLPMIIFWFGIDTTARTVIVVWSALLPLLINVIAGARNLDASHIQVSKVFCASRVMQLRAVAFPATLPYILTGVRQAVGRALIGAIVAELFMGSAGLGYLVQLKTSNFEMDDAMAAIVLIALLAVVLNRAVGLLEKKFTFWSVNE